jgi:hypothetical protein
MGCARNLAKRKASVLISAGKGFHNKKKRELWQILRIVTGCCASSAALIGVAEDNGCEEAP